MRRFILSLLNITSAKYIAGLDNENTIVKATIDGIQVMFVPINVQDNLFNWCGTIQAWVAEGNTIAEATTLDARLCPHSSSDFSRSRCVHKY